MKQFIDTNILVYAQLDDPRSPRARAVLADGGVVSVQVLNEFVSVLRRKLGRDWADVREAVADVLAALGAPAPVTLETHLRALDIAADHGLSFYDALILAAAGQAGCDTLVSEDLQNGGRIAGVRIFNPFA